jgi:hypothetical protein
MLRKILVSGSSFDKRNSVGYEPQKSLNIHSLQTDSVLRTYFDS